MKKWTVTAIKVSIILLLVAIAYSIFYLAGGMDYLPRDKKLWCVYGVKPYSVPKPDFTKSQYYDRSILRHGVSMPNNTIIGKNLAYMPAIDDPVIRDIAYKLKSQMGRLDDKGIANRLLCFAQQCVKYTYDKDQYNQLDFFSFPVNTLARNKGDCEDSGFLFTALAYHCGLDVITFCIPGHIGCGVCCEGTNPDKDYGFWIDGKFYAWCETTGSIPKIGSYSGTLQGWIAWARPAQPTYLWLNGQGMYDLAEQLEDKQTIYV